MRTLAIASVLLIAGCQGNTSDRVVDVDPDEVYTFEPGQFEPDQVPGIERLDQAAEAGDPDARHQVAFFRHYMVGDYAPAVAEFKRLAADGHLDSIKMLAHSYMDGKGVAADHERAAYWLDRAAALGDESAERDLAAYRAQQG